MPPVAGGSTDMLAAGQKQQRHTCRYSSTSTPVMGDLDTFLDNVRKAFKGRKKSWWKPHESRIRSFVRETGKISLSEFITTGLSNLITLFQEMIHRRCVMTANLRNTSPPRRQPTRSAPSRTPPKCSPKCAKAARLLLYRSLFLVTLPRVSHNKVFHGDKGMAPACPPRLDVFLLSCLLQHLST